MLEPAGALAIAGAKKYLQMHNLEGTLATRSHTRTTVSCYREKLCLGWLHSMLAMHSGHAAGSLHSLLVPEVVPACPHGPPAVCHAPPPCPLAGKTIVAIASGANMDFDRLRFVSERSDSTETLLAVRIGEKVGRQPANPPTHPPSPPPVRPSLWASADSFLTEGRWLCLRMTAW